MFALSSEQVIYYSLLCRLVPPGVRCNLVIALGDLACRFPNIIEPWTASMYAPLADGEPAVRRCALGVLTHLVLGGMVKAKGQVAKVAMLLIDDDQGEMCV